MTLPEVPDAARDRAVDRAHALVHRGRRLDPDHARHVVDAVAPVLTEPLITANRTLRTDLDTLHREIGVRDLEQTGAFLRSVMAVFTGPGEEFLTWRFDGDRIEVLVHCGGVFTTDSADTEPITAADLPHLEQAALDLSAVDDTTGAQWAGPLYVARRRHRRPFGPFYLALSAQVRPLFDACDTEATVPLQRSDPPQRARRLTLVSDTTRLAEHPTDPHHTAQP